MTVLDVGCIAAIAVMLLVDHFVFWPAFLRRSGADARRARLWLYPRLVGELWTLSACVVALWIFERRSWESLRLTALHGWRLWAATGLVFALATALGRTIIKIARPKRRRRIKMPGHAERFAPHSRLELGWWALVSLSAGFSEELIFRGYVIWFLTPQFGLWGAAALSVGVFAAAHAYQGGQGVLATGIVGALLTFLVLIFGSLWPAIAAHTLIDLQQGIVAWLLFRDVREGPHEHSGPDLLPASGTT